VVIFMMSLLLAAGMAIDIGNAYRVKQSLQASADAASAAGAGSLPSPSAAIAAANSYGSQPGGKNQIPGAGPVSMQAAANCVTGPKFCNPANTVQVTESADVPTYFLHLVGIDDITVTVHSQACSPCGALPLDVVMVLDRTGSMAGQKLVNAKQGVTSFLDDLDPAIDNVGLVVLPPAASVGARCGSAPTSNYNLTNAAYLVVPLSNDYASSPGVLNGNSNLISTLNCVQAGGGTAYANALDAAQAELDANGRPGVQKVIIFLSDGAANTGPSYLPATSPYRTQPCHTAIQIAAASKASKVLVYSIAYDLDVSGAEACQSALGGNESPQILANQAMQQIATPGNYYYQPQPTQLVGVFDAITADLAKGTSRING
jgi:Flp pilus assembly protein TadG